MSNYDEELQQRAAEGDAVAIEILDGIRCWNRAHRPPEIRDDESGYIDLPDEAANPA